jgi:SAM-dependent methyltransferase
MPDVASQPSAYRQRDQPPDVPPLELTGERTLPDVPEENYWFRRHLVVYEWIAERVRGLRAIDMACGEGYGSDVLARTAVEVVGVDANPDAHEHARLRYVRANLRFVRDLVDGFSQQADAVVFLQTIEHLQDPGATLEHFRSLVGERARTTRGTSTSTAGTSSRACAGRTSRTCRYTACSTHASCAPTSSRCGWDGIACTRVSG